MRARGATGAFAYWRINVTATNGYCSIAEIEMAASAGGANLCTGGTVTSSGTYTAASEFAASNAFNGILDAAACWASSSASSGWIAYQFASAVSIKQVRINARNDFAQSPNAFQVQHSTDGTTWATDASFSGITSWTAYTFNSFAVP